MIWDVISASDVCDLVKIKGIVNTEKYCKILIIILYSSIEI